MYIHSPRLLHASTLLLGTTGGVWCYKSNLMTGLTVLPLVVVYHGGADVLGPGLGTWSMTDVAGWSSCVGLGGGRSGVLDPMRERGPPWRDGVACLLGAGRMVLVALCGSIKVCHMSASGGRTAGQVSTTCGALCLASHGGCVVMSSFCAVAHGTVASCPRTENCGMCR